MAKFAKLFTFKVGTEECQVIFTLGRTSEGKQQIQALTNIDGIMLPGCLSVESSDLDPIEYDMFLIEAFQELSIDDAKSFFRGVVEQVSPETDQPSALVLPFQRKAH